MRGSDHKLDCPSRYVNGTRCTCPAEHMARVRARVSRDTELINLYGAACQDREDLLRMASVIETELGKESWTVKRDQFLKALIETTLTGIEKRKAKGGG